MKTAHFLAPLIVLLSGIPASGSELESTLAAVKNENRIVKVTDHGIIGDGKTLNTKQLQKSIDQCHESGGGILWFPRGKYVTGTIRLKSNITLSFDHEAELLGSQRMEDYPTEGLKPAREGQDQCLIYAENAQNIHLRGMGVIDARGKPEFFPKPSRKQPKGQRKRDARPRLMRMENCQNLTFKGLTYKDPAFWGLHLIDCRNIHFSAVTIRFQDNQQNNDGIDLDGCENVLIEDCDIASGDDAICLKSSLKPCRNIVVRRCKVSSHTAALKFGTSSRGGFIDIDLSDCHFYDCPMGAIKLQSVDGGKLENIKISRVTMNNVGCPIFIRLGNRGRNFVSQSNDNVPVGILRNIQISDLNAKVTIQPRDKELPEYSDRDFSKAGPIMITGIPGHLVENITLKNVKISFPGFGTKEHAQRKIAEDVDRYPEQFFFGILPAWGAYIRHARNISFDKVHLETRDNDERKRILLIDVEDFKEITN